MSEVDFFVFVCLVYVTEVTGCWGHDKTLPFVVIVNCSADRCGARRRTGKLHYQQVVCFDQRSVWKLSYLAPQRRRPRPALRWVRGVKPVVRCD